MNIQKPPANPLGWTKSFLWLAVAVACFHTAYASLRFPSAGWLIFGYALGLVQLSDQPTVRRAFYFGLAAGFFCAAPQVFFFWTIFGPAAILLWLVFAFWIGLFTALACGCTRRCGKIRAAWLIPFLWTGIEYFRSELYYLRFSWLNIGYAFPNHFSAPLIKYGMYGVGFFIFAAAALVSCAPRLKWRWIGWWLALAVLLAGFAVILAVVSAVRFERPYSPVSIAGIQLEFPSDKILPRVLNQALAKFPDTQIFVLSEYTLDGPVPDSLKAWCREHSRFLVVGGRDPVGTNDFYDSAFVVGTNGDVVFRQAKCVPIQFFDDGLPATGQSLWNSPWGKIGFCICYDLSYARVTDRLMQQGAQLLIVPTMDAEDWGRHEHELHTRVAPVRSVEYGIPIFRLASSGISQAVAGYGNVVATAPFPGNVDMLSAKLRLPMRGSLPPDRYVAPLCVGITAVVLVALLFLHWRDRHRSG
jgi:apolipoprotein N-acyltransferase